VDTLDECPNTIGTPSAREEVLDFVEDLVGSNHLNLFFCVTSRPEQDIQTILNPLTPASRRVSLHEEGGQREDIDSYIRSFVLKDRAMRRWRGDRELVTNGSVLKIKMPTVALTRAFTLRAAVVPFANSGHFSVSLCVSVSLPYQLRLIRHVPTGPISWFIITRARTSCKGQKSCSYCAQPCAAGSAHE
jgi:hypothetical protein